MFTKYDVKFAHFETGKEYHVIVETESLTPLNNLSDYVSDSHQYLCGCLGIPLSDLVFRSVEFV